MGQTKSAERKKRTEQLLSSGFEGIAQCSQNPAVVRAMASLYTPFLRKTKKFLIICSEANKSFIRLSLERCLISNIDFATGASFATSFGNNVYSLNEYDAILVDVFCNPFSDPCISGDILAEFSNSGRGVVVCCATNCTKFPSYRCGGIFETQNFHPLLYSHTYHNSSETQPFALGTVYIADHPLMHQVVSFEAHGSPEGVVCKPHPKAILVAEWSNGEPLVAAKVNDKGTGMVVALNFGAPYGANYWNPKTCGHELLANALMYSISWNQGNNKLTQKLLVLARQQRLTDIVIQFAD